MVSRSVGPILQIHKTIERAASSKRRADGRDLVSEADERISQLDLRISVEHAITQDLRGAAKQDMSPIERQHH